MDRTCNRYYRSVCQMKMKYDNDWQTLKATAKEIATGLMRDFKAGKIERGAVGIDEIRVAILAHPKGSGVRALEYMDKLEEETTRQFVMLVV